MSVSPALSVGFSLPGGLTVEAVEAARGGASVAQVRGLNQAWRAAVFQGERAVLFDAAASVNRAASYASGDPALIAPEPVYCGGPYVVAGLGAAPALSSLVRSAGGALDQVGKWLQGLCEALGGLHDQGVPHGLVRLEFVLDAGGGVAVTGVGLAAVATEMNGPAGLLNATPPAYRPPEFDGHSGLTPSIAGDVFAVGVCALELLQGKTLDRRPSIRPASGLGPGVDQLLAEVLGPPSTRPTDLRSWSSRMAAALGAPSAKTNPVDVAATPKTNPVDVAATPKTNPADVAATGTAAPAVVRTNGVDSASTGNAASAVEPNGNSADAASPAPRQINPVESAAQPIAGVDAGPMHTPALVLPINRAGSDGEGARNNPVDSGAVPPGADSAVLVGRSARVIETAPLTRPGPNPSHADARGAVEGVESAAAGAGVRAARGDESTATHARPGSAKTRPVLGPHVFGDGRRCQWERINLVAQSTAGRS